MRRNCFTREYPPKSGNVKRLWNWWIKQNGEPPDAIWVLRPGFWQRTGGVPYYQIEWQNTAYSVWDVDTTLKLDLAIVGREGLGWMHGDIYLE